MKILCLHGHGTSGAIFKSQTSSIRSHLKDLNLTFDFIDAPYPSAPAPGIDLFYPPPYYSYHDESSGSTTLETIQETQRWLEGIIAERGPYDLVMGFSQGCVVAAGLLLLDEFEHRNAVARKTREQGEQKEEGIQGYGKEEEEDEGEKIKRRIPFKAVIFICGSAPLPLLEHIGYTISARTKARDLASRAALASMASSACILARGSNRWTASGLDFDFSFDFDLDFNASFDSTLTSNPNPPGPHIHDNDNNNGNNNTKPRKRIHIHLPPRYTSPINKEEEIRLELSNPTSTSITNPRTRTKITIPTVHIYGERDPHYIAGIQLSEVCDTAGGKRKVYNHGGGHEIPRFEAVGGAIAGLVRWAVRASGGSEESVS
ncbi:serine hydrolase-domain-containing protein [Aspergillus crustosus]